MYKKKIIKLFLIKINIELILIFENKKIKINKLCGTLNGTMSYYIKKIEQTYTIKISNLFLFYFYITRAKNCI